MDIFLLILGSLLVLSGIVGCFLPIIPGPPLAYLGLIAFAFSSTHPFSIELLIVYGVLTVAITIFDYFLPSLGSKRSGGSKKGVWGSAIGLVAGFFILPPLGLIFLPFVGAVIGEIIDGKHFKLALKSGYGTFLGFLAGTFIKFIFSLVMTYSFVRAAIIAF